MCALLSSASSRSVKDFTEGRRGIDVIEPEMITSRSLAVVLPQADVSYQQAWALSSSYEYASSLGIDMT